MNNLLKYEFYKLKKSVVFFVILGIMAYLIFSGILNNFQTVQLIKNNSNPGWFGDIDYYNPSADLSVLEYVGMPYLSIFIIIISSLKALDDVRNGTIKNIISRGYTKTQIYFAKYINSLLAVLFYTVVATAFSYLVGLIFFGNPEEYRVKYLFLAFIGYMFVTVALHSLNFGFASLFGNLAGAILFDIFGVMITFSIIQGTIDSFTVYPNYFSVLDYMPISLSSTISHAAEKGDLAQIFINIGVSIGYSMIGIGVGYLGSKQRQY